MPKRGIDTPAKDDPNRKKPRQDSPEERVVDTDLSKSKSAPAPAPTQKASKLKQPQNAAATSGPKDGIKPKGAVAPVNVAVNVASEKKNKPASSARSGLLDILGYGNLVAKKPETTTKDDNKSSEKKTEASAPSPIKSAVNTKSTNKEEDTKVVAEELHNNRNLWGLGLIAALGLMNVASVTHFVSEQSRQNIAQMRCDVENEKLNQDLSRNNRIISVLKSGLDAAENQIKSFEQAQQSKMKSLQERSEQNKKGSVLSEEEKKTWAEKKKSLLDKRDQLLDEFNIWLSKLDEIDAIE